MTVLAASALIAGVMSEQRLAVGGGIARPPMWWPGGRDRPKHGLDSVGDELGGLGIDGDVAAQQHPADDVAGVPGRVLRPVGHVSPLS